jgi:hypothetical protein
MAYSGLRLAIAVVGAVGLAGCGLISSDVTNFDLTLPDKMFTIDATGWTIRQSDADMVLATTCTKSTTCNAAVQRFCPMDCSGSCNQSQTCDVALDINRSQTVNLLSEQPDLKSINNEPAIKVTIDSVTYDVLSNTLNVETPEIAIYVAPNSVIKSSDPLATKIGTIAPIPAGWTTETPEAVKFTASGQADLIKQLSAFKTPFNVLESSSIVISHGQTVPTGKLEAVVHIKGHAGI